jgi:hypothetical protein
MDEVLLAGFSPSYFQFSVASFLPRQIGSFGNNVVD